MERHGHECLPHRIPFAFQSAVCLRFAISSRPPHQTALLYVLWVTMLLTPARCERAPRAAGPVARHVHGKIQVGYCCVAIEFDWATENSEVVALKVTAISPSDAQIVRPFAFSGSLPV
jgi:hypothetical protein